MPGTAETTDTGREVLGAIDSSVRVTGRALLAVTAPTSTVGSKVMSSVLIDGVDMVQIAIGREII